MPADVETSAAIRHCSRSRAWISLKAVADQNALVWKWNGTRDLGSYDAWKTGYPKTPAGCVVISQAGNGQWQSVECSSKNVPLCERKFVGT